MGLLNMGQYRRAPTRLEPLGAWSLNRERTGTTMDSIPVGICQCGCGRPTTRCHADMNGYRKGEYRKWCLGHQRRIWPLYRVEDRGYKTPCWIWRGGLSKAGYGKRGRKTSGSSLAHRWYYEQVHGPVPDGKTLDHLCRQPPCINPNHLEPVTQRVNSMRGVTPKLTAAEVRAILQDETRSYRTLARDFGVSTHSIGRIKRRQSVGYLDLVAAEDEVAS